jgi:uncharacterized protein YbbK (DUF523 family)
MGVKMKMATSQIRQDAGAAHKEMGDRFIKAWKTGQSDGIILQSKSPTA